jgi:hypothetical protein
MIPPFLYFSMNRSGSESAGNIDIELTSGSVSRVYFFAYTATRLAVCFDSQK